MAQTGTALDYAHQALVVHRDIKPSSIIVQPDGTVKILGFGLPRLMKHSPFTRVETAGYRAPEQFGDGAGCSADLWGLAVTFFKLLTGTQPFSAPDEETLKQKILYDLPDLAPLATGAFDTRLPRVIAKALEKGPDKRYRSAAEFVVTTANDIQRLPPEFTRKGRFDDEARPLAEADIRRERADAGRITRAEMCGSGVPTGMTQGITGIFRNMTRAGWAKVCRGCIAAAGGISHQSNFALPTVMGAFPAIAATIWACVL